jgi:hypothetical protein
VAAPALGLLVAWLLAAAPGSPLPQQGLTTATYVDPQRRFTFEYPARFGPAEPGTDDGFQGRAAAIRLGGAGAEAVLTRGPVTVDHQAVGGLYDPIALQVLRDADRRAVLSAIPPLTPDNFCELLGSTSRASQLVLQPRVLEMARQVDTMMAVAPRVAVCRRAGDVVTFSRDAATTTASGAPRRSVYGAVRFLAGMYSSFALVAYSAEAPDDAALGAMTGVVQSLQLSPAAR